MAATTSALHNALPNRRRRVRHKVQAPAYATFPAESATAMLDLHQVVDISEDGVAIQCLGPLALATQVNLCLDLSDCPQQIFTTGQVVWSTSAGRAGLHFAELPSASLALLREWLFLNAMSGNTTGGSHAQPEPPQPSLAKPDLPALANLIEPELPQPDPLNADAFDTEAFPSRPNYTDTLAAVAVVQRQVEALGPDLPAALQLIAECAQTLVRATGAALALAEPDPDFMTCRARSGDSAPAIGARLQVGSGFSGECVRSALPLTCDDTELDPRVDRDNCRALGVRSILAVPILAGKKSVGIIEVCSTEPDTFSETELAVLQRLSETVLAAIDRAARSIASIGDVSIVEGRTEESLPQLDAATVDTRFDPTPGSVLFASAPANEVKEDTQRKEVREEKKIDSEAERFSGISLPRSHLYLMICAAATIFGVLGYASAPLIQNKLQQRTVTPLQTVLASTPPVVSVPATPPVETASLDQLRRMAEADDPAAENALGLRYFQGDEKNGIARNETQAFGWFLKAADRGSLPAQAKLGALYWGGRGIHKDLTQAYYWTVLARARGDKESKDLAPILASGLTHKQAASIEQQADAWLQQNITNWKPSAGR